MLDPGLVAAVLVTRGDVDMRPIMESLPPEFEVVVWDNSKRPVDRKVYGRYLGIAETTRPVIYFQDDDCLVRNHSELLAAYEPGVVTGNAFPDDIRLAKYHDTTLLGWGAIFDRDLPERAAERYAQHLDMSRLDDFLYGLGMEIVFPMLSRTKTVVTDQIEWLTEDGAEVFRRENRMWLQPGFYDELDWWLAEARRIRDLG